MTIQSYKEESNVSLAIRAYGHIEGLITLCIENNLTVDGEQAAGVLNRVNEARKATLKQSPPLFPVVPAPIQPAVVINTAQNLVDLALQETGSVEGLVSMLALNGFSLGTAPVAGEGLKVNGVDIVDAEVRSAYLALGYRVNTGDELTDVPPNVRLLEDGFYRLLEDGGYRLLE